MVMAMMAMMVTVMAGKPVYQAWLPLRSGRQSWNQEAPTKKQHIELLSLPCLLRCLERQIYFHKLQQIQQNMEKKELNSCLYFACSATWKRKTCLFQTKTKNKRKSCLFQTKTKAKVVSLMLKSDPARRLRWLRFHFFFNSPKKFQLTKHLFNSPNIFVTHKTFFQLIKHFFNSPNIFQLTKHLWLVHELADDFFLAIKVVVRQLPIKITCNAVW